MVVAHVHMVLNDVSPCGVKKQLGQEWLVVLSTSVDVVDWLISMPYLHFVIVKIINAVIF